MRKTITCTTLLVVLSTILIYSQKITITHLANEGILIKSSKTKLSIDGLFEQEFDYLDVLDDEQQSKLKNGSQPFDDIQFVLATHFHGDHFGADLVTKYLTTHPKSTLVSTEETIGKLDVESMKLLGKQLVSSTPELHSIETLELMANVKVKSIRIRHLGNAPWNEAENIAFLLEIDGRKILHWGDGEITKENLSQLNLQKENIDVAILPVFAIASPDHEKLINEYISSKNIILSHIPLGVSEDKLNSIRKMFPSAKIWNKQFEKLEL